MKLNVLAIGLACGLIWGLGLFIITWWIARLYNMLATRLGRQAVT